MIGSGRASIAEICDIARANLSDGIQDKAVEILASLGANGAHPANQERDLFAWLDTFVRLRAWASEMTLNVAGIFTALHHI